MEPEETDALQEKNTLIIYVIGIALSVALLCALWLKWY